MGKHHNQEYRDYVSKLVVEEGRVMREVAYELEIPYGTLHRWVSNYKQKTKEKKSPEKYITPSEHEKALKQRDKEIQKLMEENEILKKAMHIFTKNQG
ncbi:transposase [Siminovitchia terrae]|uniref:Transposase n=1 Tax=Siminovitchia terrae TaxID=1914933 RepID=A0A429X9U2_SIMTE|nr:transposase [Siminovitchia terrae]RST60184.1 transposase [Siminovitchia terrae]